MTSPHVAAGRAVKGSAANHASDTSAASALDGPAEGHTIKSGKATTEALTAIGAT
jgi:hypothetical protein